MKPHPKIRKSVKWAGLVASVVLLVVWVGSGWWYVGWADSHGWRAELLPGQVSIGRWDPQDPRLRTACTVTRHPWAGLAWSFDHLTIPEAWWTYIPIWLPTACILLLTAAAWRLDTLAGRRDRAHLCRKCGYDRRGLAPGAVCPECGAADTTKLPAPQ